MFVPNDTRSDHFGGREDDAAHGALGPEGVPLPAAWIDGLQIHEFRSTIHIIEVPVGQSVTRSHHAGLRTQQRPHRFDRVGNAMRLERDDHVILYAQLGGNIGATRAHAPLLAIDLQPEALRAHCREVRPARHQSHLHTGAGQLRADQAADRARTEDADLQSYSWTAAHYAAPPSTVFHGIPLLTWRDIPHTLYR